MSSYEEKLGFRAGDHWQFTVRLKRPRSLINRGMSFDYAAWLMSQGVTAKGYIVRGSARRIAKDPWLFSLRFEWIEEVRTGFAEFLDTLPIGVTERAVFGALSVGVRNQIDTATWNVLRDSGTAHLIAISGLHIGLVALIASLLGGVIWGFAGSTRSRVVKQDVKWCFAILAAITYALLAG